MDEIARQSKLYHETLGTIASTKERMTGKDRLIAEKMFSMMANPNSKGNARENLFEIMELMDNDSISRPFLIILSRDVEEIMNEEHHLFLRSSYHRQKRIILNVLFIVILNLIMRDILAPENCGENIENGVQL